MYVLKMHIFSSLMFHTLSPSTIVPSLFYSRWFHTLVPAAMPKINKKGSTNHVAESEKMAWVTVGLHFVNLLTTCTRSVLNVFSKLHILQKITKDIKGLPLVLMCFILYAL